jgi:hypothetical protein
MRARWLWCVLLVACNESAPQSEGTSSGSGDTLAPGTSGTSTLDVTTEAPATSDDPAGFIVEPDNGGVAAECDIWAQDCPPGEKCMPWSDDGDDIWNATRCSPVASDPGQPGDPCTVVDSGTSGIDDCALGSMCWAVDPESLEGTCAEVCSGSAMNPLCEDPSYACILANGGVLNVCLPLCDPLLQECVEGHACYPSAGGFVCGPDVSHELGAFGDACAFVNGCDPGHMCVAAEFVPQCRGGGSCCTAYCDLEDPDASTSCPGSSDGQECVPFFEEGTAPPRYESVGVCAVPQ